MMKNDYRRALILLRSAQSGVNGHVRLERRTLMGSMQFTVSGLNATLPLQAAMAARTASGWKIVHIGTLGRDSRGQAGLHWTFDPRNIEGLPLEKYSVLLVLQTADDGCRALLTGYVNGSVQVDWERVEQAACASYTGTAAADEGAGQNVGGAEAETGMQNMTGTDAAPAQEDGSGASADISELDAPARMETPAQADTSDADQGAVTDHDAQLPGTTPIFREPDTICDLDIECSPSGDDAPEAADVQASMSTTVYMDPLDVPAGTPKTAMEALGLDAGERWPEGIEPLREAFAASEPIFLATQPDHVFVRMAHSQQCPQCAVGVRAEAGKPKSVAYAIPGEYSQQPPAGLEGYLWQDGWWIAVADADTGAYLHI